jgi:hypothetical protein
MAYGASREGQPRLALRHDVRLKSEQGRVLGRTEIQWAVVEPGCFRFETGGFESFIILIFYGPLT